MIAQDFVSGQDVKQDAPPSSMDANETLTRLRGLLHDHHIGRPHIFDDIDRELVEASERELLALTDEIHAAGLGAEAAGLEGWGAWLVAREPIDPLRLWLARLATARRRAVEAASTELAGWADEAWAVYASEAVEAAPHIAEMVVALWRKGLRHLAVEIDGWASWRADGLEWVFGLPWQTGRPDLALGEMDEIVRPLLRPPWKPTPTGCGAFFFDDNAEGTRYYYITAQNSACDYHILPAVPWTITVAPDSGEPEIIAPLHSAAGVAVFLEAQRAWRAGVASGP